MHTTYDERGFTLIEILICTVIITVASLAVTNLTAGIMRGTSFSNRLTTAITLGQDRLEHVKRVGYANVSALAVTENYGNIVNYSGFKRITSIADNSPISNMRTITVTVYWNSDKHSINLATMLAE